MNKENDREMCYEFNFWYIQHKQIHDDIYHPGQTAEIKLMNSLICFPKNK